MPKRIDEPCPICGRPCSTWAISVDTNEDMVLCWEGDYKVRGLENHRRLSRLVQAAKAWAKAKRRMQSTEGDEHIQAEVEYLVASGELSKAVEGGAE